MKAVKNTRQYRVTGFCGEAAYFTNFSEAKSAAEYATATGWGRHEIITFKSPALGFEGWQHDSCTIINERPAKL